MKIVVGFILTPEGEAALDLAIAEAKARNAELVVIHSERGGASEHLDEVFAYREAGEEIEARLRDEGITYVLREYVRGLTPAEDLSRAAQEEGADLIVIGLRKRSLVGKMLLGSNATEILMDAPCPVLTVRASYDED